MFGLGLPELLLIALIVLLFFGAKRLPDIGTGLGKTVKEIRNIKKEMSKKTKKTEEDNKTAEDTASDNKSIEAKLADKVVDQIPGMRQAKNIKDKAEKIKKIVS